MPPLLSFRDKSQQQHRKVSGSNTGTSHIKLRYLFKSLMHRHFKEKVAKEQLTARAQSPHLNSYINMSPPSRQPLYQQNIDSLASLPGISDFPVFSQADTPSSTPKHTTQSKVSSRCTFHMRTSKSTSALLLKGHVKPSADESDVYPPLLSSPSMFDLRSHSAGDYGVNQLGQALEKLSLSESQYATLEADILPIKTLNTRYTIPRKVPAMTSGSQDSPTSDMIICPPPHCSPKSEDTLASGYLAHLKKQLQEKRWSFIRSPLATAHIAVAPTILITSVDAKHPRPLHSPVDLLGPRSQSKVFLNQPLPLATSPCLDDPFIMDPFADSDYLSEYILPSLPSTPPFEETRRTHTARCSPETPTLACLHCFPTVRQDTATGLASNITNPFDLPPFSVPLMKPGLLGAAIRDA